MVTGTEVNARQPESVFHSTYISRGKVIREAMIGDFEARRVETDPCIKITGPYHVRHPIPRSPTSPGPLACRSGFAS